MTRCGRCGVRIDPGEPFTCGPDGHLEGWTYPLTFTGYETPEIQERLKAARWLVPVVGAP